MIGLSSVQNFWVAGINYRKSDARTRGRFAISREQYERLLARAPQYALTDLFLLSTCNRTEVYGFAEGHESLVKWLCTETAGTESEFLSQSYILRGEEAIRHLFRVSCGLDSQILGDYEIVGQIKQSVEVARRHGFMGSLLDRIFNFMMQTSKKVKNHTQLSGGTVSVSFAAIQYLRTQFENFEGRKVVIVGAGKIGRNTCKNVRDYMKGAHVTLVNRSRQRAEAISQELGIEWALLDKLPELLAQADIIITATSADAPIITPAELPAHPVQIVDLSVPANVDPSVTRQSGVTLVNVDELSRMRDETLQKRLDEVPRAERIIEEYLASFATWLELRNHRRNLQSSVAV